MVLTLYCAVGGPAPTHAAACSAQQVAEYAERYQREVRARTDHLEELLNAADVAGARHELGHGGNFAYVDFDAPEEACICGLGGLGNYNVELLDEKHAGLRRAFEMLAPRFYRWQGLDTIINLHEAMEVTFERLRSKKKGPSEEQKALFARIEGGLPPLSSGRRPHDHSMAAPGLFFHRLGYSGAMFDAVAVADAMPPWASRRPVAVWRGATPSKFDNPRRALLRVAGEHPELFDVQPCNAEEPNKFLWPLGCASRLNATQQMGFKYTAYTFGTMEYYSSRLKMQLASGFAILMPQHDPETRSSDWYEQYLLPHEHFLPLESEDFSDAPAAVEWLRANDDTARRMGEAAQSVARNHLSEACILEALSAALDALKATLIARRATGQMRPKRRWKCPTECLVRPFVNVSAIVGKRVHHAYLPRAPRVHLLRALRTLRPLPVATYLRVQCTPPRMWRR